MCWTCIHLVDLNTTERDTWYHTHSLRTSIFVCFPVFVFQGYPGKLFQSIFFLRRVVLWVWSLFLSLIKRLALRKNKSWRGFCFFPPPFWSHHSAYVIQRTVFDAAICWILRRFQMFPDNSVVYGLWFCPGNKDQSQRLYLWYESVQFLL